MEMNLRPKNNLSIQLIEPQDPEIIPYIHSLDVPTFTAWRGNA